MKKIKKVTIVTGIISLVMAGGYIVRNVYSESKSRLENLRVSHKQGFYEKYIKRPQDFCCALAATIVLSPIMGITALLVRVKLGSPVIFKQERPGLNGKIFTLFPIPKQQPHPAQKPRYSALLLHRYHNICDLHNIYFLERQLYDYQAAEKQP